MRGFRSRLSSVLALGGCTLFAMLAGAALIQWHSADTDTDGKISLSELLRVIQLYNSCGYQESAGSEDGFAPVPCTIGEGEGEGEGETVLLPGDVPLELQWISAGSFTMGSPSTEFGRDSDETEHAVTLSQGFWMGKVEVTQAQWQAVMGINPSVYGGNPNRPVENVSWNDCQSFLTAINALGLGSFRLPTEAEWEYACRASTATRYYWGEDPLNGEIDFYAWFGENSGATPHEVGSKLANLWGLFDMSGNVWEWTADRYGDYPSGPVTDPTGPASGSYRAIRGASWKNTSYYCRSAGRFHVSPSYHDGLLGFRLVR